MLRHCISIQSGVDLRECALPLSKDHAESSAERSFEASEACRCSRSTRTSRKHLDGLYPRPSGHTSIQYRPSTASPVFGWSCRTSKRASRCPCPVLFMSAFLPCFSRTQTTWTGREGHDISDDNEHTAVQRVETCDRGLLARSRRDPVRSPDTRQTASTATTAD